MREKKKCIVWLSITVVVLLLEFAIEQFLQPGYLVKSICKVCLFMGTILLYSVIHKTKVTDTIGLYPLKKAGVLYLFMAVCFVGIGILFFLLKDQLDLAGIRMSLMAKENLTKENCLFVFGYIILCNSFLEESFFRGFVFRLFENRITGAVVSGVLFSLYHIGIVVTWFNPFVFALCVVGLALVGMALQWLSERYHTIAASWLAHGCANIAINIIGALLIFEVL